MPQQLSDSLTPAQQRFVLEYLKDEKPKAAAIRAGYSPRNAANMAYDLLRLPKIKEYIEKQRQQSHDRIKLDADWVMKRLMEEADNDDNSGGERIRALELLGKRLGLFIERKEVTHNHNTFFAQLDMDEGEFSDVPALEGPTEADWSDIDTGEDAGSTDQGEQGE